MANHKNLKKVIAVSSMAAATMGAGAMVNADNVHQQPVSSSKSSISTKVSSESQSVKSSSKVVLKSSQASSAKATTSSVASSSSSAVASSSSAKQAAQPMNLAATVTPSMTSAQHDTIQNDINNVNNVINKYQSDHSLPVSMASSNFGTDLVTDALGDYTSGLATKEELQKDVQKVQGVLNDDKDALAKETNAHAKEILQAQVKLDQDAYNLLSQAVNGNASQASSSKTSSTKASKKSESKASSASSKKASSSSKADNKKASSQSSAKASSQASKKKEANVTSAVNALKNDADKYQNSSDAITKSYAQEVQQWLDTVQSFANNGQNGSNDEINFLKNDMKSLEDTLNASWFKGNVQTKQIMQDQINADKAMLAYLTGQNQGAQQASSTSSKKNGVKAPAKKASSNKAVKNNGVKNNAKVAAKAVKANHQATVSSKKAATANSAKKASMPQTGEANNAGILAGIGALAIAAAGAFLFRKRG